MKKNYKNQFGEKLIVKEKGKVHQIDLTQISHIESEGHISTINTITSEKISLYKLLKFFEDELTENGFFRVNRKTLINLNNMILYKKSNGKPIVKLVNNIEIPIARRRLSELINILN